MMAKGKPRCTVVFTRGRKAVEAHLMYKGERLNSESLDFDHPMERALAERLLMSQCKERVAARTRPGFDAGRFFRMLDDTRARRSR